MRAAGMVCAFLLAAGAASAQEGGPRYPLSLVDRPLLLPSGLVAIEAAQQIDYLSVSGADDANEFFFLLGARIGAGPLEGYLRARLLVSAPDFAGDVDTLDGVSGGALIALDGRNALRIEAALDQPSSQIATLLTRAGVETRRKPHRLTAIQAFGGAELWHTFVDDPFTSMQVGFVAGELRLQGQVSPRFALELVGQARVKLFESQAGFPQLNTTFFARALVAVGTRVDGFAGYQVYDFLGLQSYWVGLEVRVP